MKNEMILSFGIWNFDDITPREITDQTGYMPERVFIKGESRHPDYSGLVKENGWVMGSGMDKHSSFKDQLTSMIDKIEIRYEIFKYFCSRYSCVLSCAIILRFDNGESLPSIRLDERYNKIAADLNFEFDVDLYNFPNH